MLTNDSLMPVRGQVYVFISPHLDDTVLSCGGLIHQLASSGERVINVTVITADQPDDVPLTWLAGRNHTAWQLGDRPFAQRRIEDVTAAAILGMESVHLGMLDAIYRRDADGQPLYTANTVRVPAHPFDRSHFIPEIRQRLSKVFQRCDDQPISLICPLSIGMHVDHVIVRSAVEGLSGSHDIAYYEDYPYTDWPGADSSRALVQGNAASWSEKVISLEPEDVTARIAAAACYTSQLRGLFPSAAESLQEIVSARVPIIGRYARWRSNPLQIQARVSVALRAAIARTGGERYWYHVDG
jgi:LmbE family N-acetylglucosaminyl deacetylase